VLNFPLDNFHHQQWNFETELPVDGSTSSDSNIQYDRSIRSEGVVPVQYAFGLDDVDASGREALYRAIHNMDINQVESLLGQGAAVDVRDTCGNQALHHAVDSRNPSLVKLLLRYGADIDAAGNRGYSPLHLAISISDANVASLLVDEGASIASQDHNGDSALHLAVIEESWNRPELQGLSHQIFSAPFVDILIAAKADMNIPNVQGSTPFHKLLNRSSEPNANAVYSYITKFIGSGASVHLPLRNGLSPFEVFLAKSKFPWDESGYVRSAKNTALRTFVEHGADPSTPLPSREPLILHFISNCLEDRFTSIDKWQDFTLLDLLCSKFRNSPIKENGNTTLHQLALTYGNWRTSKKARIREAVETLLNKGEDPNRQNSDGETPLLLLLTNVTKESRKRVLPCLKTLLAHGADPMILDSSGNTGLFAAAKILESNELCSVLEVDRKRENSTSLEHRSQPNSPSRFIWSDWEQAIREEHWEDAKMHVLARSANIPSEIAEKLRDSAFKVLAGTHIDLAKTLFQGESDAIEKRRKLVATILRDCQLRDIELEVTWMKFLITLC
jgi:ankyrin repeat protein